MKIFPVVHVQSRAQAVTQSDLAASAGADGVYLIDHGKVGQAGLFEAFNDVAAAMPGAYVGLNLLNGGPDAAYQAIDDALASGALSRTPDALWVDDVRGGREPVELKTFLDELRSARAELRSIRHVGGIAFKYTSTFTEDADAAAAEVSRLHDLVDVVTTSGAGTGTAPTPAKIAAMKGVCQGKPLAVASGISADNLRDYDNHIDELLVATSIETTPYSGEFDLARLATLVNLAHARGD